MILYDYFRSTTCYRVRIALHLKQLSYEAREIHLIRDGGAQHHPDYIAINPQQRVPTLLDGDVTITQSLAIIEYLDEAYPTPYSLLPDARVARAHVRALAQLIACSSLIHFSQRVLSSFINRFPRF